MKHLCRQIETKGDKNVIPAFFCHSPDASGFGIPLKERFWTSQNDKRTSQNDNERDF
ncbi:MAG: hypothetical protein L6246_00165 [Thermodesulfovibrionales bacterium]|nr:hypothetical protein [Nitrospinota bacterium]MCG2708728.1 hypothetical protein [Thermodesulfovibrionales bacterium]